MKSLVKGSHVDRRARMHSAVGRGHGHRGVETDAERQTWRVQVAGLGMVERVGSSRRWRIVARRGVRKVCERKRVGIQERRREPPWVIRRPRSGILVSKGLMGVALGSAIF